MSSISWTYTWRTVYGPIIIPRIWRAAVRASSRVFANLIPPAFPRPPTRTCAFTAHGRGGSTSASRPAAGGAPGGGGSGFRESLLGLGLLELIQRWWDSGPLFWLCGGG